MLPCAQHGHIGAESGVRDRTQVRYAYLQISTTVDDVTEPAGIDSGVSPPWFRQRAWQLLVIDLLPAVWITVLTVNATEYTALGLSSGTIVVVWLVALAVSVPLLARRRKPIPLLAVVLASTIIAVLLGMSIAATGLAVSVELLSVAVAVQRWEASSAFVACIHRFTPHQRLK